MSGEYRILILLVWAAGFLAYIQTDADMKVIICQNNIWHI